MTTSTSTVRRCPCGCKHVTTDRHLFAPGHDMRHRRMIREAASSRSQLVRWDTRRITVAEALERVTQILGSDWSQVPGLGARQVPRETTQAA